MVMGTKVEVRTIPLHGLFIHRKQGLAVTR